MARRAEWRARHDDPRTWLGWLAQDGARPAWLLADRLGWTLRTGAVAMAVGGAWPACWICVSVSFLPDAARDLIARWRLVRPLPVGALLTLPPLETEYPCRVEVSQGGTLLGSDVGVATFVDGWLCYEGCRTSFALKRTDMARRRENRIEVGGGAVEFFPQDRLRVSSASERNLSKRFRANLESWERSDGPEGEGALPPLAAHPSGVARAWIDLTTGGALLALGALFVSSFAPRLPVLALPLLYGLVVAVRNLVLVAWSPCARPAVE